MDDRALAEAVLGTLVHEHALIARHRDGLVVEGDGYAGSALTSADATLANAVVVLAPGRLTADHVDEIARSYADAGIGKWGVWVEPDDDASKHVLEQAGLVLDSAPRRMAIPLHDIDLDDAPEADAISLRDVGRVNDLAYGHPDNRLEAMIAGLPPDALTAYGAFDYDNEPISAVITTEHDGDAGVWMVATVPWARGQGLAKRLMRRALADAKQRGCTTTTLLASRLGAPVYAGMGYRDLGPLHLWERRP